MKRNKINPIVEEESQEEEFCTVGFIDVEEVKGKALSSNRSSIGAKHIGLLKSNVPYPNQEGVNGIRYHFPEYNFSEIIAIMETESLVSRSFSRKEVLCLKQGFDFVGKNKKTVQYIKRRLHEIALVSNMPTTRLLRNIAADLVQCSNSFGSIVRNRKLSSGRVRTVNGKRIEPIAGLFMIPYEGILLGKNKLGHVVSLAQQLYGSRWDVKKRKEYKKGNYFHFKINERTGFSVGTPLLTATKDDILALRRLEEDVEIMLYQHMFPLYQIKIGTEKAPAMPSPNGQPDEVEIMQKTYGSMPAEGAMVTSERVEIKLVSNKNGSIDPFPSIKHFKQRVLAGLEISSLDIGESDSSNRSTSESLSRILVDGVKYLQRRIEEYFNQYIIQELLLESTFPEDEVLNHENMVYLKFREIDVDEQIKVGNHKQLLFANNVITQSEARRAIGEEPLSEEERLDTYQFRIEEPRALLSKKSSPMSAEAMILAQGENSSLTEEALMMEKEHMMEMRELDMKRQEAAMGGNGKKDPDAGAKSNVESQVRPMNQHGKKPGSEGRKSSSMASYFIDSHADPTANSSGGLLSVYDDLLSLNEDIPKRKLLNILSVSLSVGKDLLVREIEQQMARGVVDVMEEEGKSKRVSLPKRLAGEASSKVQRLLTKVISDIESSLSATDLSQKDQLQRMRYRISMIENNERARGYNTGRAYAYKTIGYDSVVVEPLLQTSCKSCLEKRTLDLKFVQYKDMPPLSHPNARQIVKRAI